MDRDDQTNQISRRRMLKRVGATAVIAWTAPMLTSIRTPAFAASGSPCACAPYKCPNPDRCSDVNCFCVEKLNGDCLCTDVVYLNLPPAPPICANDADCVALGIPGIDFCVKADPGCGWSGDVGCADKTCNLARQRRAALVVHRK